MRGRVRGVEAPGECASMRTIRSQRLAALAILPFLVSTARAQAPRGPYYQRTTTPGFVAPRGAARSFSPSSTPRGTLPRLANGTMDRLQPYTETSARAGARAGAAPLGNAYSNHPRVAPPRTLPAPPPAARNYFPTARFGQGPNRNVRDHCTPSRGGLIVGFR